MDFLKNGIDVPALFIFRANVREKDSLSSSTSSSTSEVVLHHRFYGNEPREQTLDIRVSHSPIALTIIRDSTEIICTIDASGGRQLDALVIKVVPAIKAVLDAAARASAKAPQGPHGILEWWEKAHQQLQVNSYLVEITADGLCFLLRDNEVMFPASWHFDNYVMYPSF